MPRTLYTLTKEFEKYIDDIETQVRTGTFENPIIASVENNSITIEYMNYIRNIEIRTSVTLDLENKEEPRYTIMHKIYLERTRTRTATSILELGRNKGYELYNEGGKIIRLVKKGVLAKK